MFVFRLLTFLYLINIVASQSLAQQSDKQMLVHQLVNNYIVFSTLGNTTGQMDESTILQFRRLFMPDAMLYWDLYKSEHEKVYMPFTLNEYIEKAKNTYKGKQPLISYPPRKIRHEMLDGGASCIVYMRKVVTINSFGDQRKAKQAINLRMLVIFGPNGPLIQNILAR